MPELSEQKILILEKMQNSRDGRLHDWDKDEYIDLLELADSGLIRHEFSAESLLAVEWFLTDYGHEIVLP